MPEQELSDVFEQAVGDAVPDLGLLVAGAAAEGNAIRLRRRAALAGTVAAVAALAVGAGLLLRAQPPASALSPAAGSSTTPAPSPSATLPNQVPLTAQAVAARLAELLGPDRVIDTWNGSSPPENDEMRTDVTAYVRDLKTGRTGTVQVQVTIPGSQPEPPNETFNCAATPTQNCEVFEGTRGEQGVLFVGAREDRQVSYASKLRRAGDGVWVVIVATGMDGREPVVEPGVLTKWALDPAWQPFITPEEARNAERRLKDLSVRGGPPTAVPGQPSSMSGQPGAGRAVETPASWTGAGVGPDTGSGAGSGPGSWAGLGVDAGVGAGTGPAVRGGTGQ